MAYNSTIYQAVAHTFSLHLAFVSGNSTNGTEAIMFFGCPSVSACVERTHASMRRHSLTGLALPSTFSYFFQHFARILSTLCISVNQFVCRQRLTEPFKTVHSAATATKTTTRSIENIHGVTMTEFCSISMPVDFCRHLVGINSAKCSSL